MKCCNSLALFFLLPLIVRADDWPQFRGPNRDGVSLEKGLLQSWSKEGPKLLWSYTDAGVGYAGPAVVGDRLYLCGGRGDSEYVFALDLKTSESGKPKQLWAAKIGPLFQWKGNTWNSGPNVTPTVDGDTVYALGGFGDLLAVDRHTGKLLWSKNLPKDFGGEVNPIGGGLENPTPFGWGYANSPLIDGDRLVIVPGGKKGLLAALNKKTGESIWQSKEIVEQSSYSSPIRIQLGGVQQYVQVVNAGAFGVHPSTGKLVWSYRREPAYDDVVVATPVFSEGLLFSSVGFNQGSDLVRLTGDRTTIRAEKVYSNKAVENRDGGVVLVDGHLYGHSENKGWFCQEFKTGKIIWSERENLPRGSITYADGNLYLCPEKGGVVVMIEATPKGWNERGRLKLPVESKNRKPSGGMWTYPVIADGKLYLRDQELLHCYDLRK